MSSSLAYRSELTATFPALDPEISADMTDGLIAAVRGPAESGNPDDQFGRETTLIAEVDAFHPRDLEETVLVVQLLSAHHGAIDCFRAAGQCEVTSKEASRLRRDAIALQRSLAATLRALHKSQARPISDEDLVPRPTVPTSVPRRTGRGPVRPEYAEPAMPPPPRHDRPAPSDADQLARDAHPAAASQGGPDAQAGQQAGACNTPDTAGAEANAARPPAGGAAIEPPGPKPRRNPFDGHPDLQRLNERWNDLPPWEQMTMEERRETWGYNYTPKTAEQPQASDQPPAG